MKNWQYGICMRKKMGRYGYRKSSTILTIKCRSIGFNNKYNQVSIRFIRNEKSGNFQYGSELHPHRYQRKRAADEIGMIEDVLRLYNAVAEPFMDANNALTQQTRSEMLQIIRKIQPSSSYFVDGLARMLGNSYRDRHLPARRDEI